MTGGILQTAMTQKFRIDFNDIALTSQVMDCDIDMKRKLLTIKIRQPIVAGVLSSIKKLLSEKRAIEVQLLANGNEDPLMRILLDGCECVMHNCSFNYGKTDYVSHSLTFSYDDINEFS